MRTAVWHKDQREQCGLPLGLESTCDAQRDGTHLPDVFAAWEYRPYSVSFLERVWKFLHRLLKIVECWQPVKVKNKQNKPLAQPCAKQNLSEGCI